MAANRPAVCLSAHLWGWALPSRAMSRRQPGNWQQTSWTANPRGVLGSVITETLPESAWGGRTHLVGPAVSKATFRAAANERVCGPGQACQRKHPAHLLHHAKRPESIKDAAWRVPATAASPNLHVHLSGCKVRGQTST